MDKEKFIEVLSYMKSDIPFLLRVIGTALENLPENTEYGIAEYLYFKHIYTGKIVKCTSIRNRSVLHFAGMTRTYEYIKGMYPKAAKSAIGHCLTGSKKEAYDHTFQYITKEEYCNAKKL